MPAAGDAGGAEAVGTCHDPGSWSADGRRRAADSDGLHYVHYGTAGRSADADLLREPGAEDLRGARDPVPKRTGGAGVSLSRPLADGSVKKPELSRFTGCWPGLTPA